MKIKIIKPDKVAPRLYVLRVELDRFLDNPIIKFVPTPKMGDGWYADIFIEDRTKTQEPGGDKSTKPRNTGL